MVRKRVGTRKLTVLIDSKNPFYHIISREIDFLHREEKKRRAKHKNIDEFLRSFI